MQSWAEHEAVLGDLGAILGDRGAISVRYSGYVWGHLWAILGFIGAILELSEARGFPVAKARHTTRLLFNAQHDLGFLSFASSE